MTNKVKIEKELKVSLEIFFYILEKNNVNSVMRLKRIRKYYFLVFKLVMNFHRAQYCQLT